MEFKPNVKTDTKTEIIIRPYVETDFVRMEGIHDPARRMELELAGMPEAFLPLSIAAKREGLFDYNIYVAEYAGIAVGFIAFTEDEIAWLYVDINYLHKGIGSSLLEYALRFTNKDVSIEVLSGNAPAIALYSNFGFRTVETLNGKMPGNEGFSVTVHVMKRSEWKDDCTQR